jgi:hypothetical protein
MAADDPLVPTGPRASLATFLHSLLIRGSPCLFSCYIRKGDEPHVHVCGPANYTWDRNSSPRNESYWNSISALGFRQLEHCSGTKYLTNLYKIFKLLFAQLVKKRAEFVEPEGSARCCSQESTTELCSQPMQQVHTVPHYFSVHFNKLLFFRLGFHKWSVSLRTSV